MLLTELTDEATVRFARLNPGCLDTLDPRRRAIFSRRRLVVDGSPETFQALAKEYGVTRERIRQLEQEAFRKIRKLIRSDLRQCQHCNGRGWT